MLSALGVLFGAGDGFRQLCRVLGMKVTAPRRAGYKAADLVGTVHRSSLSEAVAVGGVPAEASKSSVGEWGGVWGSRVPAASAFQESCSLFYAHREVVP